MPEANMLPNVKGFKVFPHLLVLKAAAYFCRSKTLCSGVIYVPTYIVFKTLMI